MGARGVVRVVRPRSGHRLGTRPGRVVWVLDFVQERLHNMSAGDCEDAVMKAGNSETRKGFR